MTVEKVEADELEGSQKQKGLPDLEGLQISGGADGTRTRDPRRDRPCQLDSLSGPH